MRDSCGGSSIGGRMPPLRKAGTAVGADGYITGSQTGDAFIVSVICTASGTLVALKDGQTGTTMVAPGAMVAGDEIDCHCVACPDGIYADWTNGSFIVVWGRAAWG